MILQSLVGLADDEHSRRVSKVSGILARYAGYSHENSLVIQQAAQYHDIGKSAIARAILDKPGKLTPQEFGIIKTHTRIGAQKLADAIKILFAAKAVAAQHHEKWDGTGYIGLSGADIHPYARLVSIADVWDALISKRAYKAPMDIRDIICYFENHAGSSFDPGMVSVLLEHTGEIANLYHNRK